MARRRSAAIPCQPRAAAGRVRIAYEFQRSQRRTIGLSVGPRGLSVRAPRSTPLAEVDALVQRKAGWVLAKLRQVEQAAMLAPAAVEWRDGGVIAYLGRCLELACLQDDRLAGATAALDGRRLLLAPGPDAGPDRVRELAQAWLLDEARRIFVERLDHFAPRLGVPTAACGCRTPPRAGAVPAATAASG